MPGAPEVPGSSPLASLVGNLHASPGQNKEDFFRPYGCVVRNTFLEWHECEGESSPTAAGERCEPRPPRAQRHHLRARSCPEKVLCAADLAAAAAPEGGAAARPQRHAAQRRSPPVICTDHGTGGPCIPATLACLIGDDATSGSTGILVEEMEFSFHHAAAAAGLVSLDVESSSGQGPFAEGRQKPQRGRKFARDQPSVVLRGLPFNATETEVFLFLEQAGVLSALAPVRPIVLLNNAQGRPSGFAEIHLNFQSTFWEVQEKLHMQRLGGRYIEALPPRNGKFTFGTMPFTTRHSTKRQPSRRF